MTIRLHETLRALRQQSGMTQSALAEALGVSDRAVSRWETAAALPDVTLLPRLAALLHVSVDALLGLDGQRRQSAIDEALAACSEAMQQGRPADAVSGLRQALAAWPDEPELMVALARSLMALHTEEAAREALSLCRAADGRPARLATQYGCKQVMALALHRLGRSEQAARLVSDEMPSFWVSRELLYPRVAPPEKAEGQRQFNLLWLADHVYLTLRDMARFADAPAVAAQLTEKAIRILREAAGEDAGFYELHICQAWMALARAQAELALPDEASASLRQALASADRYASFGGRYAASWLARTHGTATPPADAHTLYASLLRMLEEPGLAHLPGLQEIREALNRCLA